MTERCGAAHPEDGTVVCDKAAPCFVYHANAFAMMTWPGTPLPPSPVPARSTGSARKRLAQIAQRAR